MERAAKLLSQIRLPAGCLSREELACAVWPQAVGKRIARHTRAVSLADSRLMVEVEDPIWEWQLSSLRKPILSKLQELLGPETVSQVQFRLQVPRRLPQRAEELRSPQDEADRIENPCLRRLYKSSRRKSLA
jgi:predicted nucleic acid-binding Zn ribbon protein